jgi:hypothetical protein
MIAPGEDVRRSSASVAIGCALTRACPPGHNEGHGDGHACAAGFGRRERQAIIIAEHRGQPRARIPESDPLHRRSAGGHPYTIVLNDENQAIALPPTVDQQST